MWDGLWVLGGFTVGLGPNKNLELQFDADKGDYPRLDPYMSATMSYTYIGRRWDVVTKRKIDELTFQAQESDFVVGEMDGQKVAILYLYSDWHYPPFTLELYDGSGQLWKRIQVPTTHLRDQWTRAGGILTGSDAWAPYERRDESLWDSSPSEIIPLDAPLPPGPSSVGNQFLCWVNINPQLDPFVQGLETNHPGLLEKYLWHRVGIEWNYAKNPRCCYVGTYLSNDEEKVWRN